MYYLYTLKNFLKLYYNIFTWFNHNKEAMASGTPSAQVRVPVGDFIFPPPPQICSHYTTWGKNYKGASAEGSPGGRECERTAGKQKAQDLSAGVKNNRRRHDYPRRVQVGKKFEKKLTVTKTVAQCRKYPIPYLFTLSQTIPYLYTLNRTTPYLYTLNRTIPYLNTLSRNIPYLNTLRKNTILAQNQILVGSQSETSTIKP